MKFSIQDFRWTRQPERFTATFTNMEVSECKWLKHDGQAPDTE